MGKEEETGKNIGYKAAVIILISLLICSNVVQFNINNDKAKADGSVINYLYGRLFSLLATEAVKLDHFADELDWRYIHILTTEPVGFIDYSSEYTGFRTVMYNVTFDIITEREVNGSIEVWLRNYTRVAYMTFDVAVANNQEPMKEGNIYKFYYIDNAYKFLNVIYYEKITTGEMDFELSLDGEIYINESFVDNTELCFYDRNGTLLFSGDYTNETLMNASLNLNMTLRQFIFIIMPTFDTTIDTYDIFEQIAEQLKESNE